MKVDPAVTFWISLVTTIAQGVTAGTIHLTNIVPPDWIPYVTSWLGLIVFVNMSFLTAMSGFSSAKTGVLAAPPTLTEAHEVLAAAQKAQ